MNPFYRRSKLDPSGSEGADMVAAMRATITPFSPSDFLEGLPNLAPPFSSPPPLERPPAKSEPPRNRSASNEGNRATNAVVESDLRPAGAVSSAPKPISLATSRTSATVSLAGPIQACGFCLSSIYRKGTVGE